MRLAPQLMTVVVFLFLSVGAVLTVSASGEWEWPKVTGQVVSVDLESAVFAVKSNSGQYMTFHIASDSRIMLRSNSLFSKKRKVQMDFLKTGQTVSVKYYGAGEEKVARHIKVFLDGKAVSAFL